MTPPEWPLRFVPRRSPPFLHALCVSVAAMVVAIGARAVFLGFDHGLGLSVTYFPAFMAAALFGGARWGWVTLAAALGFYVLSPSPFSSGAEAYSLTGMFVVSGVTTILGASALRETLLRLEEMKAAESRAQADLATTEARFRLMADSAPVLMWLSNIDGTREFVNRAYVEFLGLDYEVAMTFDWRKLIHPDDLERIAAEEAQSVANGGDFIWEARYRRGDGEHRWIRSVSQRRYLANGELCGYVGVGYDVTDARQAQADLTRINDLLAERVRAALVERDEAEAALRHAQKLEAVGQLTGGVAHDFNNLLTVVIGALDLIQRHPKDEARRERMIEAALGAARRGERLTQQLLAFSRRQALKPERVAVDELLAESESLLRRAVGEAVSLTVTAGAPRSICNIDISQFEAAVMNLVVNARDATPPGGGIRVESQLCQLKPGEAEGALPGDYLCVSVHDTGQGMDAQTVTRVFEPFFTTKGPGRGTGLGLSQVYGFARQSGGAAVVESALGKGATVRIYLPLVETADYAAPALKPGSVQHGPSRRILLVEDDASVGEMVEAMLVDLGHQVLRVETAAPALTILRRNDPVDLMLTDLIMPGGMNGVELAHAAVALRPGLPVILTSGYTGETLGAATQAPWPLLAKPYPAEALATMIDTAMKPVPEAV